MIVKLSENIVSVDFELCVVCTLTCSLCVLVAEHYHYTCSVFENARIS